MQEDELDRLIRRERRRQGWQRCGLLVLMAGFLLAGVAVACGDAVVWSDQVENQLLGVAAMLALLGMVGVLICNRGRAAKRLDALLGQRDAAQRRRTDKIYAMSVAEWGMVAASLPALLRIVGGMPSDGEVGFVIGASLAPWLIVGYVVGWEGLGRPKRKLLEDEFTRDIRRRALAMGFLILLFGMAVVFGLALFMPAWVVLSLPLLMMTGCSAVGFRFVWLDQQAEYAGQVDHG